MDTFHLFYSEGEPELNIYCCISIMRRFEMVVKVQIVFAETKRPVPAHAFFFPAFVPLFLRSRANEELHFHLLEFTGAENKLTGNDFVSESFTDLCNAKRNPLSRSI